MKFIGYFFGTVSFINSRAVIIAYAERKDSGALAMTQKEFARVYHLILGEHLQ